MECGLPWYKREPRAFLDGVQGMGPELIGAYAVLLDLIYARAGRTPRDDRHLAGVVGCSVRKARSLTDALVAQGKIEVEDDGFITNSRAKSEAKSRRMLSETRANAGRKGGEAKAGRKENNGLDVASASGKTLPDKRKRNTPYSPPVGDGDRFEEFWSVVPRKIDKGAARKAWAKALRQADASTLIAAMQAFAQSVAGTDPKFVPHPATWLNGERWLDGDPPGGGVDPLAAQGIRHVEVPDDDDDGPEGGAGGGGHPAQADDAGHAPDDLSALLAVPAQEERPVSQRDDHARGGAVEVLALRLGRRVPA